VQNYLEAAQQVSPRLIPGVHGNGGCCAICDPFDIPVTIETPEGRSMNPLADAVRIYDLALEPFPLVLTADQTTDASLVNQAEENHLGDMVVSHMYSSSDTGGRFSVFMTSQQTARLFMNAPVLDRLVFPTRQLANKLPCCYLIQATNFVQMRIRNLEAAPQNVSITAFGRRLLPYQYPELRPQFLSYWNSVKTTPFWLTIDRIQEGATAAPGSGVVIAPGATATVFMTVPGAGDFQIKDRRCVVDGVNPNAILIFATEGIGRAMSSRPLPLGDFVAQPNTAVAGLQGGEFRAASGSHSDFYWQLLKRNSRIRITLENTGGAPATVFLAFVGCMQYYEECAPGRSLERALSLEPTVGPMLIDAPRCPPIHTFDPMQFAPPRTISPTGFTMPTPPPAAQAPVQPYTPVQEPERPILGYGYGAALPWGLLGGKGRPGDGTVYPDGGTW
jgi:hypothetical protein